MRRYFPCPDCGEPIYLQPSGWWTHDGLPNGCWRLSMDGPDETEHAAASLSLEEFEAWQSGEVHR